MITPKNKIFNVFFLSVLIGMFCLVVPTFAADSTGTATTGTTTTSSTDSSSSSCAKKSCSEIKCSPTYNSKGVYNQVAKSINLSSKCLAGIASSSTSCFNSVPVSFAGSYEGIGNRSPTRNHYGSDIGGAGNTAINVYAAADGVVKYKNTSTGGGRTIVIEHTKACSGSTGTNKYKTVYRHLFAYKVSAGDSVSKGDIIGIEGGSDASRIGGAPCDNSAQKKMEGYTTAGCTKDYGPYAIHLHLELANGPASGSSSAVRVNEVMSAYCPDVQSLCGGCAGSATCLSKGVSSYSDGTVATTDGTTSGGDASGSASGDGGGSSEDTQCKLTDYLDSASCTFCDLFRAIYNAASTIAKIANEKLLTPCKKIVLLGFVIWICIFLLKQLSTYSEASTGEMLKGLIFQGFRVAVVVAILSGAVYDVMDLTLNPVMRTGLSFVQTLNSSSDCGSEITQGIVGYDSYKGYANDENASGGLSIQVGQSILCSIKNLEDATGFMMKLGYYSMCLSVKDYIWLGFIPHLAYLTTGIFLWLCGLVLLLTFPWCLVDCVLQLCVAAALIPCSIAAFAFKPTAKYIKVVWSFFMNAMFNFVFMAVIIYIINNNLKSWIGYNYSTDSIDPSIFVNPFRMDTLAWYSLGAIKMFAVCFFCWCFFEEAKKMADRFSQGAALGGSKGIGRMVGGTLAGAAQSVGKPMLKAAGKTTGTLANAALGASWRSGKNHLRGIAMRGLGGKAIKDANGKVVGYQLKSSGIFGRSTRTVTKDENGNWVYKKDYKERDKHEKYFKKQTDENGKTKGYTDEYGNQMEKREVTDENGNKQIVYESKMPDGSVGARITTDESGKVLSYKRHRDAQDQEAHIHGTLTKVKDAYMSTTLQKDGEGNVVKNETQLLNASSKFLINKDGTTNMKAVEILMNGSSDKSAAVAEILNRHLAARGIPTDTKYKTRTVTVVNQQIKMVQSNGEGKEQQAITAHFDGKQLIINSEKVDENGNITKQTSNGMQTKTTTYEKEKDGTYTESTQYSFSDKLYNDNKRFDVLDAEGQWGRVLDPESVMRGFTTEDYEQHVQQIRNGDQINKVGGLSANAVRGKLKDISI
jgi:hypothetical protein